MAGIEINRRVMFLSIILLVAAAFVLPNLTSYQPQHITGAAVASQSDTWMFPDCQKRIAITIPQESVDAQLVDFSLLIKLNSSFDWSSTKSNLADIRFTDENGYELISERKAGFDYGSEAYIWVRVPVIHYDRDTIVYMYYSNPSAVLKQASGIAWEQVPASARAVSAEWLSARGDNQENPTTFSFFGSVSNYVSSQSQYSAATWWDNKWKYRKGIQVQSQFIDSDLQNFKLLVKLDSSNFNFSKALPSGADIRFVDSRNNELTYEIESWTSSSAYVWVNVPTITSNKNTLIYIYFGNPSAISEQNKEEIWISSFTEVYHLAGLSDGKVIDSVGNNNFLQSNLQFVDDANRGKVAKFNGVNSYFGFDVALPSNTAKIYWPNKQLTYSVWIKPEANQESTLIIGKGGSIESVRVKYNSALNKIIGIIETDADRIGLKAIETCDITGVTLGTWTHFAMKYDGEKLYCYKNGIIDLAQTKNLTGTIYGDTFIYRFGTVDRMYSFYNGSMDEIRISNQSLSDAEIKASYLNENYPTSFAVVGDEEPQEVSEEEQPSGGGEEQLPSENETGELMGCTPNSEAVCFINKTCQGKRVCGANGAYSSCQLNRTIALSEVNCDGIDNDCNGKIDEAFDEDEDDYIDDTFSDECSSVYDEEYFDCDPEDPTINPDAAENCIDGIDNNCDGLIDSEDPDCNVSTDDPTGLSANASYCGDNICDPLIENASTCCEDCGCYNPMLECIGGICIIPEPDAVCGNNLQEIGEECDGSDSMTCPGGCSGCRCMFRVDDGFCDRDLGENSDVSVNDCKNSYFVPILILLVLVALGFGAYLYFFKPSLDFANFANLFKLTPSAKADKLETFISSMLAEGHKPEEIKAGLLRKGFDKDRVEKAMLAASNDLDSLHNIAQKQGVDEAGNELEPVLEYVDTCVKQGFKSSQIKAALISVGWPEELVDEALTKHEMSSNSLNQLAKDSGVHKPKNPDKLGDYISNALSKGFTKDQIRETLLKSGWKENEVDVNLK